MEDGWQMDGWRDSPCIQHDFDPSNSLWGHCPAYLTTPIWKYQSRVRVPMTIFCQTMKDQDQEGFYTKIANHGIQSPIMI